MKKKTLSKPVLMAGGAVLLVILLALANYLSGALLFLTFKENPVNAQFLTIEEAYLSDPDAETMKKIELCAGASLFACIVLPFAAVMQLRSQPRGKDLYGHSGFADMDDIQQEKLDAPRGVVIGKFKNQMLRMGGSEFILLAAPTRTGKGVGFCVPNLLQFQDSAVILDIKGENYNLTSEFRRRYMGNEIVYLNPFSENTKRWNPLSYVSSNPSYRINDLMAIATIIYPVNEKDPFWSDAAKNLFVGLGLLVLETPELPKTIGEILRQGSGKGNPIEAYLTHVLSTRAASPNPLSPACRDCLNRFLSSGETALKGIVATFSATLTPFANDVIDKATSGDDFDLRDVRKKKMSIYLHIPAGEILQASFIINLFFSQLINENVKELPEQNPALKYQCLLLMDEFTAMGKVSIVAKGVGFMAGYNMRLAIVIQDKAQLEAVYGKEDAHNIISNMGAVIYFTPSQINEAEEYSKMIGNNTVLSDSRQRSKAQLFGIKGTGGDSTTESFQSRAVMLPQELLSMSKDAQLVVRSGIPVIKADKIRYYTDDYFKERFNAVPTHQVSIGGEKRKVPVPAKLPQGDWTVYRESIKNSDFYARTMPAPAAQGTAADSGAQPATTASAAPVAPSAAETTPMPTYTLPKLPDDYTSFSTLYDKLSTEHAPISTSAYAAAAYADGIIRYWQLNQSVNEIDDDEQLVILDLSAGNGQFAWQVMSALFERLGAMNLSLPPFRYIACVDTEEQTLALNAHPYFRAADQLDLFVVTTLDELTTSGANGLADNPCVVLAHGLFSRLQHDFIAVQNGELFGSLARVTGNPAPQERELELVFDWPSLSDNPLPEPGAAVANMYLDSLADGVTLLPSGALTLLDEIRRMTDGKFMLMCVDNAVAEEQDIRLGAYSPHTKVTVPLPAMPTNYHALSLYLRSLGANIWQEKIQDSTSYFMVALYDAEEREVGDGLPELLPALSSAHNGEAQRFTKLVQRQLLTIPDCLALLQRTNYDPLIIDEFYPVLEAANWKSQGVSKQQWQQALAQCWSQYLPRQSDTRFYKKIVPLAMRIGNFGLARECLQASAGYFGENVDDLCLLAICALETGDTSEAQTILRKVLANQRLHPAANTTMAEAERRVENEKRHPWFDANLAKDAELRIEPLSSHHAEQYHHLYRDPQIGALTMLPALPSLEQTKTWIASESAEEANTSCAVMHENWGLIGFVCAQCNEDTGFFSFWIGADYQGNGYGKKAGAILMNMLDKRGIHDVFSSSFSDNRRSHRALKAIGFRTLTINANAPYDTLAFFHMGICESHESKQEKLEKLCETLSIPFEFETAAAEQD